jgi:short-subunit dehydrogenase
MKLEHQRIVLTGAASGIGLALLKQLADRPGQILAVDVNASGLETACKRLEGGAAQIIPYACDLSTPENVDALFETALRTLGRIDLFFANAGFAYYEEIRQPDWAHIERIFRLNTFNTFYTIEKMQSLYGNTPYKVVVTASAMAFLAVPGYALYSATKAALHRFADAYRWQLADRRKLMLVYPIATRTGFFRAAGENVPAAWPSQTPEAVARAILRGVRFDRQTVSPSPLFSLFLLLDRFLPLHWLEQAIEQRRLRTWLKKTGGH